MLAKWFFEIFDKVSFDVMTPLSEKGVWLAEREFVAIQSFPANNKLMNLTVMSKQGRLWKGKKYLLF